MIRPLAGRRGARSSIVPGCPPSGSGASSVPAGEVRKVFSVRGEQFVEHRLSLCQIEPCRDGRLQEKRVQSIASVAAQGGLDHLLLKRDVLAQVRGQRLGEG